MLVGLGLDVVAGVGSGAWASGVGLATMEVGAGVGVLVGSGVAVGVETIAAGWLSGRPGRASPPQARMPIIIIEHSAPHPMFPFHLDF